VVGEGLGDAFEGGFSRFVGHGRGASGVLVRRRRRGGGAGEG
jgi:hypothetical protein